MRPQLDQTSSCRELTSLTDVIQPRVKSRRLKHFFSCNLLSLTSGLPMPLLLTMTAFLVLTCSISIAEAQRRGWSSRGGSPTTVSASSADGKLLAEPTPEPLTTTTLPTTTSTTAPLPTRMIIGLSKARSHGLHRRWIIGFFNKILSEIFKKDSGFAFRAHFNLVEISDFSPPEVLQSLCDRILDSRANAVFYISDADLVEYKAPAASYLLQIADFVGLPVIVWMADKSGLVPAKPDSTVLLMTPSVVHQATAMLAVLDRYNWRAFAVVTGSQSADHDHFVDALRHLAETMSYNSVFEMLAVLRVQQVDNDAYLHSELLRLNKSEARVILLYATHREADRILAKASSLGQTGKDFIWILSKSAIGERTATALPSFYPGLLGLDYDDNQAAKEKAIRIGLNLWAHGIDKMMKSTSAIPPTPAPPSTDVAENAGSELPRRPSPDPQDARIYQRTLTVTSSSNASGNGHMNGCGAAMQHRWTEGEQLVRFIKNVSLQIDGATVAFDDDGTMKHTELNVINLDRNRKWTKIGQWSTTDGLQIGDITWPGWEPTPPKGRPAKYHLKVVTLQEKPYVMYSDPEGACPPQSVLCRIAAPNITKQYTNATTNPKLYQCCSGLCIDLLKLLGEKIGFDFELFEVPDRKWGAYDKEAKEWNGLIKSILDGEADMIVTALQITPERSEQIDFSVPFLETGISILVAVRDGVISPTAFLEPYDYASWCLILLFSVHASGAAMFLVEWLSPMGLDRGNKPLREHKFSLFRAFWLIWSMLFGAAVNVDSPRGVSSRFLASVWALFAVVFTASYTANLAAFMITKEDYDRITGIKDPLLSNPHLHQPPFKFATVPQSSTETNLMKNFYPLYEYMKKYSRPTAIDGVKAVKDGEINAFIYDATVLEYLASHDDKCGLKTVGSWFASTGYGIGFPKESRWIEIVNKFMVQFQHDGEMERLQKFWMAGACKKNEAKGEASKPLGVLNFTSAFILLACGMLLAAFLLLLEHVYFSFFRVRLRKCDTMGCCSLVSLSLGKSLTFQQSVREAIEMTRTFKCRNPVCETQVWKLKHELDMARLNINRLQHLIQKSGMTESALMSVKRSPQFLPAIEPSPGPPPTCVVVCRDTDDWSTAPPPPRLLPPASSDYCSKVSANTENILFLGNRCYGNRVSQRDFGLASTGGESLPQQTDESPFTLMTSSPKASPLIADWDTDDDVSPTREENRRFIDRVSHRPRSFSGSNRRGSAGVFSTTTSGSRHRYRSGPNSLHNTPERSRKCVAVAPIETISGRGNGLQQWPGQRYGGHGIDPMYVNDGNALATRSMGVLNTNASAFSRVLYKQNPNSNLGEISTKSTPCRRLSPLEHGRTIDVMNTHSSGDTAVDSDALMRSSSFFEIETVL